MNTNEWVANPENEKVQSVEEARFIFEQAEKQLKRTTEIGSVIVSRTTTLLTIITGIIITIIGYNISLWIKNGAQLNGAIAEIHKISLGGCIYLMVIEIILCLVYKGHFYYEIGSTPRTLFVDDFFQEYKDDSDSSSKKRLIYLYQSEIHSYQTRINRNKEQNKKRWSIFHLALGMTIFLPVVLLILFVAIV